MVDLFIALFGGLYYGGRYIISTNRAASYNARFKQDKIERDALYNQWWHDVVDTSLERHIEEYISDPANADEVDQKLSQMLEEIGFSDKFSFPTFTVEDVLRRGLLAEYGKIPAKINILRGERSGLLSNYNEVYQWKEAHKFYKWWDEKLINNGVKHRMLLTNGIAGQSSEDAFPVAYLHQPLAGYYHWFPLRSFRSSKFSRY